jgi:hypothetical protein
VVTVLSGMQQARRGSALARAARRVEYRRVIPDLGCYEERYRLTGRAAPSLVGGILSLAVLSAGPLSVQAIFIALSVVLALPWLIGPASRMIALRADYAGITLGADPAGWPLRRIPAVFVHWADVEQIILYPLYPRARGRHALVRCIGIRRRQGAPALPRGNEPDPSRPVPGVAAGATRRITTWRLDRERLAAIIAAVAPGIPVIDASSAGPNPSSEASAQVC